MEARWGACIFSGKLPRSDESMIFTEDGKTVKIRSMRLMLEAESWDPEMIEKITTSRWKAQIDSEIVQLEERDGDDDSEEDGVTRDVIPKDFPNKEDFLEKLCYTDKMWEM